MWLDWRVIALRGLKILVLDDAIFAGEVRRLSGGSCGIDFVLLRGNFVGDFMGRDQYRALLRWVRILEVFRRAESLATELDKGFSVLHLKIEIEFVYRMTQ